MRIARHYSFVIVTIGLASCISLLGGIGLEVVEAKLLPLVPLVIALPALSTLTSDYASIVAARAADPAEQKKTKRQLAKAIVKSMWINIFGIVVMSLIIAVNRGYLVEAEFLYKFVGFMVAAIFGSIIFLFGITVVLDRLFESNKISQDDVFIPIITSLTNVAMLIFVALAAVLLF